MADRKLTTMKLGTIEKDLKARALLAELLNRHGNIPLAPATATNVEQYSLELAVRCVGAEAGPDGKALDLLRALMEASTPEPTPKVKICVQCGISASDPDFEDLCMQCHDGGARNDRAIEATSDAMADFWETIVKFYRRNYGVDLGELPQWDGSDTSDLYDRTFDHCVDAVMKFVTMRRKTKTAKATEIDAAFCATLPEHEGWKATWEYPGFIAWHHAGVPFTILINQDEEKPTRLLVDRQDPDGGNLGVRFPHQHLDLPTVDVDAYMKVAGPILSAYTPRVLVVTFDVTGMMMDEVAALESEVLTQADDSDDHPNAPVLNVSRDVVIKATLECSLCAGSGLLNEDDGKDIKCTDCKGAGRVVA